MTELFDDFFLHSLNKDLMRWYYKYYYPPGYRGSKEVLGRHLALLPRLYEKYLLEGLTTSEMRVKILTEAQDIIDNSDMEDI